MNKRTEQAYLAQEQYQDGRNLKARIALHQHYSTSPIDWHEWVFDQLDLPEECRILELGCGTGLLWQKNADRIPSGWHITLTDLSAGMVAEAKANLIQLAHPFEYQLVDIQYMLFNPHEFDVVIANHMLYHVPDVVQGLREVRRVLKPDGRLFAATIGANHLKELRDIRQQFFHETEDAFDVIGNFGLQNGAATIQAAGFDQIERRDYENDLRVTAVEPLVDYAISWYNAEERAQRADQTEAFRQYAVGRIAENGAICIQKETGLFIAS